MIIPCPRGKLMCLFFGFVLGLSDAHAHVERLAIEVVSLLADPERDHFIFRFRAVTTDNGERYNLPRKEREFTVHLRLDPDAPATVEARRGMDLLRDRFQKSPEMVIGRMSGKGWRAIAGRKGEFRSIGVKIHHPKGSNSDVDALVYFIHDDRF